MVSGAKSYDVIVIGSGSGADIVDSALSRGLSVAWVDRGPLGGTCDNVGCIPSKMLTVPADRILAIREAARLGISADIREIDFRAIMERMRRPRAETQRHIREAIAHLDGLDFYETAGHFVGTHELQAGAQRIRGDKIFVVAGARPAIPPIEGLEDVPYLTNDTVFDLVERPDSMVIIGGGYIACELGHFFAAVGTDVTIVQRNERLVPEEEPEISELLLRKLSERMRVITTTEVVSVRPGPDGYVTVGKDRRTGELVEAAGQQILVATGRTSNADLLQVATAGIETDARGYIVANPYLETNVPSIWALGDVIGKHMFKHTANREASIAWYNAASAGEGADAEKVAMDYSAVPHAVFTHPQIAAVGLSEAEARKTYNVIIGRAHYNDVAYGMALGDEEGFAKAVVDAESRKVLGFHIAGPDAAILIQEVINSMAFGDTVADLGLGMHIHPALPELIVKTLGNLQEG